MEEKQSATTVKKHISKKTIIIASAILGGIIAISLTLILILTSNPFVNFFMKMEKEKNFKATATLSNIPLIGSITMQAKQDGNVFYMEGLSGSETYTETVGDDVYEYTKDSEGNWIKTKKESGESDEKSTKDELTDFFADLADLNKYTKVEKNRYEQKEDVEFENCDSVSVTLDGDECIVEMDVTYLIFTVHAKIVISDVGEVELTLPEVK